VLARQDWPTELLHPVVAGVFVGGCVIRGDGSRFRAKAHAHYPGTTYEGWLCVLSARRLTCRELLLHELAHLLAPGGHHARWRAKVLEIGGTLDPVGDILRSYHPRSKGEV
jgi:hypothetical protein